MPHHNTIFSQILKLVPRHEFSKLSGKQDGVRRTGFYDVATRKHYVFVSKHFDWSANTIAEIYKQRWQVELFFKWIKQNLKIKSFISNSDNAVMTQIMIALWVYLILAFIKFYSGIAKSLQQINFPGLGYHGL